MKNLKIVFFANSCNVLYIENELRYFLYKTEIEKLIIYTEFPVRDLTISGHDKVEVRYYGEGLKNIDRLTKTRIALEAVPVIIKEYFKNRRLYKTISTLISKFNELRNEMAKANIAIEGGIPDDALLYSYWGAHEAFIMSVMRKKGLQNKNLTRLHGFDLYEELDNGVPLRWFIRKYVDNYVTISEHGRQYFIGKYPELTSKVNTFHLGIDCDADDKINRAPDNLIRVISCGWVNHHKNYDKIFYSLNEMPGVEWVHLGGGGIIDEFEAMIEPQKKIKIQFTGLLNRNEIFDYYRNNEITCFMSLSSTEGLPVSMMEAQAFGIPIISSDVGGCAEIVNENTGILLGKEYTFEDVRNAVMECANNHWRSIQTRQTIHEYFMNNFNAEKNYNVFYQFLTGLS